VFLSSNAIEYKKALIVKLGANVVEELECTNEPYRYTVEELTEIIKKYRQKLKSTI
jgi:prefoldin subunit 5